MRPRDYIGYGAEAGITLSELVRVSGTSNRTCRKDIETARLEGETIVNFQDGNGFYRADDPDELERYKRIETARGGSLFRRIKVLEKTIDELRQEAQYDGLL